MKLLEERAKTHGDYNETARTAQKLKDLFRYHAFAGKFTPKQIESLDMIATKLARLLHGDINEPDHFRDIAGYALLAIGEEAEAKDENA